MFGQGSDKTLENPKLKDNKYLKDNGIDPHELKTGTLREMGIKEPISYYNTYVDKVGNIWLQKNGTSEWIDTMVNISTGY